VISVDIVTAVRNEEACIPLFVDAVGELDVPGDVSLRVLFVEDSSTDRTLDELRRLSAKHDFVRFMSLHRGYGQCAALVFGMAHSDGDAVVMMDADGSHPVGLLPEMIGRFRAGFEVVQAVRGQIRNRRAYRNVGAAIYNLVVRLVTGVDLREQNVYFRLVSRRIRQLILADRRCHGFLRLGFSRDDSVRTAKIAFDAAERTKGRSKYHFLRLLRFSVDGLLSVVPPLRGAVILLLLLGCGCLVWDLLGVAAGCLLFLIVGILAARYAMLCTNRVVDRLSVREQA
jgi:dolichol-phosphate mannosyltransferase